MSARIAILLSVLFLAAPAAAAASLRVRVGPAKVHPGQTYKITVTGRFTKHRRTRPYLLVFIQYGGAACKRSGTAEYALPARYWSWDVFPRSERRSPFKHISYWKATGRLGARRVCAYLYPKRISSVSKLRPLARASARFRDLRRS